MKRLNGLAFLLVVILLGLTTNLLSASSELQGPTPKRISFATGQTGAMVNGILPANSSDQWVLKIVGGQTLNVNLTAWNGAARLVIWGADGTVLISDHADATYWSGTVPSTQDYNILVTALNNTTPSYTLDISVPPLEPTPPMPGCINRSAFIADITVPDGTPWQPNQGFNKIWRVQNTGTCSWSTGFQLAFAGGEQMTNISSLNISRVTAPGQTLDLLLAMNAPAAFGTHSGRWQLRDENGILFGTILTVQIKTIIPVAPPQVSVVSPGNGFNFGLGAAIRVTYSGTGGTELSSVVLLINGAQVAKQTSRTPTSVLTGVYDWRPGAGNYDLYAIATDLYGQQSTSAHVTGVIAQASPQCQPSVDFRADNYSINAGQHTLVRWDVDCVQAIYFEGQGVTGHEVRDVQPGNSTTYTLRVIRKDGSADERRITINVNSAPPPPPPPQRRDINGQYVSGEYLLELYEANGCGSADCHIAGRLIRQMGVSTPQIVDVQGSINVYSGAASFAATVPGGQSFNGTLDASSRNLSGTLSGVGGITFSKQ